MDGKSQEWRDRADAIMEIVAERYEFITSDIVIAYLWVAGLDLEDYSALGGVFKRAANKGLIEKVRLKTRRTMWQSQVATNMLGVRVKR